MADTSVGDLQTREVTTSERNSEVFNLFSRLSTTRLEDNVLFGKDEFPTHAVVDDLLTASKNYTVHQKEEETSLGFIIVTPSVFFKDNVAAYAEIRILPSDANIQGNFTASFSALLDLAVGLSDKLGYEACVFESFFSNVSLVAMLRDKDFSPIAVIPRSGYVYDKGWQESYYLLKTMRNIRECLPHRSVEPTQIKWNKTLLANKPLTLTFPIEFKAKDGRPYLFDVAKETDAEVIMKLCIEVCENGLGYANTEMPTLAAIYDVINEKVEGAYYFVIRDPSNKAVLGTLCTELSIYTRTVRPKWADLLAIMGEHSRGKGMMTGIFPISNAIVINLGCDGIITDTFINNKESLSVAYKNGYKTVGTLPRVGYLNGNGWTDNFVQCHDLSSPQPRLFKVKGRSHIWSLL